MKKKIIIVLLVIILLGVGGFLYIYKTHRDISSEKQDFTSTAKVISLEFLSNENKANAKYLDKTIEIKGTITSIDLVTKSIVIDEKLFATFADTIPKSFQVSSIIIVKGRFVGYDGLLEEMKMDQCVIIIP